VKKAENGESRLFTGRVGRNPKELVGLPSEELLENTEGDRADKVIT
jgi:hypothetical protein